MSALTKHTLQSIAAGRRTPAVRVAVVSALVAVMAAMVLGGSLGSPAPLPSALPVVDAEDEVAGDGLDGAESATSSAASALPVMTYETFLSRDPFEPVVPEEEPVSTPDPSDPVVVGDPSDPDAPLPVVVPSNPDEPRCVGQEELVCDGRVVTLLEITEIDGSLVALIQVDTTVYEVRVGDSFGGTFLLLAIDPPSVTILYGDESNVLSPGRSILK